MSQSPIGRCVTPAENNLHLSCCAPLQSLQSSLLWPADQLPAGQSALLRRGIALLMIVALLCACASGGQPRPQARPAIEVTARQAKVEPDPRSTAAATRPAPVIVEGTGRLVGTPSTAENAAQVSGDGYQLNFVDAEIATVVASVVGDALGLPYLLDPQVKGTMTLQVAQPLARNQVLPALEAALGIHGVALVQINGVYQVVQSRDAPRRVAGLRSAATPGSTGFAIEIVPIEYVSVADIEKVLRPLAPDGGIVRADEGRSLLLIAGTSGERAGMREVIRTFDVDWLAGMSFGVYPVEYVDVGTLADELGNIFSDTKSPIAEVVRMVPLARLNSLLVMTHQAGYLKEVEAWVRRLDIGVAAPGRRIYVYDVQNGKADDLAESLSKILSIAVEEAASPAFRQGTDTFEAAGTAPFGPSGTTAPVRETRASPASTATAGSSTSPGALKIVPNVENNALLIYATPNEFAVIESAVKRLDVVPIQVLIEASLAEVTLTDDLRYGLQWAYQSGTGPVVLSESSNGIIGAQFPGFSYLYSGRQDIRAVLNAIENMTDVNVISSPKLLVLNNREAELQIGDQVPITTQSAVSTIDDASPIVNSVQLRDTGVILRITPRVNKSGLVLLDVAQEVSDVVPTTTSTIDSPTIQQRRISSTIAVRDGETVALGGLIRDSNSRTRSGIPYLRKIPLLGDLFGSTSKNNRRTELIVLITPRVVRSQQESAAMMDDLREQFRGLHQTLPQWQTRQAEDLETSDNESSAAETSPETAKP